MTNPTDPRVEAAARVVARAIFHDPNAWEKASYVDRGFLLEDTVKILKAVDKAAWQPIESAPKNQRLKLAWCDKNDKWRFEFGMASWDWKLGDYRSGVSRHHAATHWQPLPTPPETP